jgi:flagellar assembly protein FliH
MTRERDPLKQSDAARAPQFLPKPGSSTAEPFKFRVAAREPRAQVAPSPPPAPPPVQPAQPATTPLSEAALEKLATALQILRLQSAKLAEQARADALEIGFQIAHRILETEIRTSPESLFALIRSALHRASASQHIVVRLSPVDASRLRERTEAAAKEEASLAVIEVQADASLAPGDCMVDADFGTIDGRIQSRLQEMRRAIDDTRGDVG